MMLLHNERASSPQVLRGDDTHTVEPNFATGPTPNYSLVAIQIEGQTRDTKGDRRPTTLFALIGDASLTRWSSLRSA